MRNFTIYDMFERNAQLYGAAPAISQKGQNTCFKDLFKQVNQLAAGFKNLGIAKGERVAILAFNHSHFFTVFGAVSALGAIAVPINWRLSAEEIRFILQDCSPKLLITDSHHKDKLADISIKAFNIENLSELMSDSPLKPAKVSGDDPFCLIYTAAMEGQPRGAILSHSNIIYADMQTAATMGLSTKDAYLNMLPLFHITGLNLALGVMHTGGKNVLIPKFDVKDVFEQTQAEKVSVWGSFPPMLSRLSAQIDDYDVSYLRHVLGLDSPETIQLFEEQAKAVFWILYGQTETTGLVTFSPALEKQGSAGKTGLLTKIRIVDDEDQEMGLNKTGEILVQGPLVFQGFWNQNGATIETFRNEWHHTGDLGQLDSDGYLWFKGRKPEKELIKPGGENVYPAEVEAVILQHPDVAAVCVIGVPDSEFGEAVKAVCEIKPKAKVTPGKLVEFVAARIARYKKPSQVEFVEKLPRKSDHSIDRDSVKKTYGG